MKINTININQTFGLNKTNKYKELEQELIYSAARQGRKDDAEIAANAITKLLPGARLGYDKRLNIVILTTDSEEKYNAGGVNKKLPLVALTVLYKNLANFQNGDKSGCNFLKKNNK